MVDLEKLLRVDSKGEGVSRSEEDAAACQDSRWTRWNWESAVCSAVAETSGTGDEDDCRTERGSGEGTPDEGYEGEEVWFLCPRDGCCVGEDQKVLPKQRVHA